MENIEVQYPFGSVVPGSDAVFPRAELDRRVVALQERLGERGIDLLLLSGPENIFYLCGQQTPGYYTFQCLCIPSEGEPFLFLRGLEGANARANVYLDSASMEIYGDEADPLTELARMLERRHWIGRRIAIGRKSWFLTIDQYERLVEACGPVIDGSRMVESLRIVKSPLEIEQIERAAVAAQAGMQAAINAINPGATENEVAAALLAAQVLTGSEWVGMQPFVCSGARCLRHATWRRRVLQQGETVTIENAACYGRYHAALYRTAVAGTEVSARVRKLRDVVVEGLERGLEIMRPGKTCADVHNTVQGYMDRSGYHELYRKRTGYSIGLAFGPDWGEGHILSLNSNEHTELKPGMTFHMPISLCDYGRYTLCASETIIITESGNRVLSTVPRRLF